MDPRYIVSGLGVGFIVGLTGVGGGSLMTPILVFLFGFAPSVAVGTDLLFAAITKLSGVWAHHRRGTIDWSIVGWLSAGSLPAAGMTLAILRTLKSSGHRHEVLITAALGIALLLTAGALLLKRDVQRVGLRLHELLPGRLVRFRPQATVVAGIVLGVLVTLTSVGAGALGAVALVFLYPWLPARSVVGTDIAHAVPLAAIAGLGHLQMQAVDVTLLAGLLAGSLPGIYLGSALGARVPEPVLRTILASMLLLLGLRFLM